MKKNQGITLIALIVTIIILIILAGITIALISGGDGILAKATAAVDKNNIETAKEQVTLKIGEYQSDFYEGRYVTLEIGNEVKQGDWIFSKYGNQTIDTKNYQFKIEDKKDDKYVVRIIKNRKLPGDVTGTLSVDGKLEWDEVIIADSGSGKDPTKANAGEPVDLPDAWGTKPIVKTLDETGKKEIKNVTQEASVYAVADGIGNVIPIPKGFYYVGGTKDTGVVISDNSADENRYANFVNTDEVPEGIPTGVAYKENGTVDVTNSTLKGNQFVWIPCTAENYTKYDWGITITSGWDTSTNIAEKVQIEKYGGFYVGRYEAGTSEIILKSVKFGEESISSNSENANFTSNNVISGNITSKAGEIPYYHSDYRTAVEMSEKMYKNDNERNQYVTSGLVTGTMWDVLLNYISTETNKGVSNASSGYADLKNTPWGNYKDSTLTNCKGRYLAVSSSKTEAAVKNEDGQRHYGIMTCASTEEVKKKNIYDLAGNLWEWTQEYANYSSMINLFVLRGGSYYGSYTASDRPVCCRGYDSSSTTSAGFGFRPVLYIK